MAITKFTDVIEPSIFEQYMQQRSVEMSALWQSGIVANNPRLNTLADSGGHTVNMPFFDDLGDTEANIGNDDDTSDATAQKITTGQDISIVHNRNQMWGSADLVQSLIGPDPMRAIADLVAGYWTRQWQRMLISSLTGVLADNIANDSGDMVHDIGTDDAGAITAAEKISGDAVIDAAQTMGDHSNRLVAICMHSVVYSELQKQNLITFVRNSEGVIQFPSYLGMRVIVDDLCPADAGTNRIEYTTYLFAQGAFGIGRGNPRVPVEIDRAPAGGNGGGIEHLHSRQKFILHPRGVKFVSGSVASTCPTNAELEAAANWDRVYDRKLIRVAALKTNG